LRLSGTPRRQPRFGVPVKCNYFADSH
jgi:ribosome-associated protein